MCLLQQKRVICCSGFLNVQHAVAPLVVAAVACTVKSSTSLTFTSRSETLLSMLIRLHLLFGMKRIKLFRLALVPILLSFLLTVFACAPATPEEAAVAIAEDHNMAGSLIADSEEYQNRLEYALRSNWAVSKVKAPGVKTKFTTLEQVEPGIYQVRVEILCVVTYEVAGRAMDKSCGRSRDLLVHVETGEVIE